MVSTAYLLISHGSRDPRPQSAMNRLAQIIRDCLRPLDFRESVANAVSARNLPRAMTSVSPNRAVKSRSLTNSLVSNRLLSDGTAVSKQPMKGRFQEDIPLVGTAVLELGTLPLHQQIYEFGRRAKAAGMTRLQLVPVFLMKGIHVMQDIPVEVKMAEQLLAGSIELSLCEPIGSHPGMSALLRHKLKAVATEGKLLVAHGSRRPKGNHAVEQLAKSLGMSVAYWATPPDLETQVIDLMQLGHQELVILPYFLFSGAITDTITHLTEELAERFPRIRFRMLPPVGATQELAELVVNLVSPSAAPSASMPSSVR